MMALPLATFALLLAAGIGSPSTIRAAAALDPAGEQIALIRIAGCSFEGARVEDPMCEYFILEDTDRTHVIQIPGGDKPVWSPDGTQLLVVSQGDIFVISVTGDTGVNLTNHPAYDSTPAWSPDGSRIAFSSDRDGPVGLYVMNANGSNVVRIATDASQPTWSPDSTRLAFSCGGICMINADGSGFSRLTTEADYSPAWSPDGAKILFVTERYGGFISTDWGDLPATQLAVMNTDGSNVIPLNTGASAYDPGLVSRRRTHRLRRRV
jgi:TolB protein